MAIHILSNNLEIRISMKKYHPLITGTIILTTTGLISRLMGFFYRIFLSQKFGAESMGIYQLIYPAMALSFSICASGIQTAISKYVANETTTNDYKTSWRILLAGISISFILSLICATILYKFAPEIAENLLLESRCTILLKILAISIPFGAIHSCINGYFYGIKQTKIPALTQIIEQTVRVSSVFLLYEYCISQKIVPTITLSIIGLLLGEIISFLVSALAIYIRFYKKYSAPNHTPTYTYKTACNKIIQLALPLTGTHIIINLLQSVEASSIPFQLQQSGLSACDALSIYGVLTGMALPLVLFPCALTNSVSVLLLPIISEAETNNRYFAIKKAIEKSICYCFLLGFASTIGFLLLGNFLGTFLFHSKMAATFIRTLSFICPFLYLSSTLSSILHGLGKTVPTFIFNTLSLLIRLGFIFLLIPTHGIKAYLWGILCSQILQTLLIFLALKHYVYYNDKRFFKRLKN